MKRLFHRAVMLAIAGIAFAAAAGALQAATPAPRLLATYQPVMHFDPLEKFRPASVQSFISDSDLERLTAPNTWTVVDSSPEPGDLPGAGTGIWRLNQDSCTPSSTLGGLDCYAAAWNEGSGGPVVYGHVAHDGDHTVLQYWFFYYDDVYSYTYPPSNSSGRPTREIGRSSTSSSTKASSRSQPRTASTAWVRLARGRIQRRSTARIRSSTLRSARTQTTSRLGRIRSTCGAFGKRRLTSCSFSCFRRPTTTWSTDP
jgi:hypothetical protein